LNLGKLLLRSSLCYPNKIAIYYGEEGITYKELNRRVNKLANGLKELGIREGDRIALWLYNCPQFIEAMYACWKAGFIIVPMHSKANPREVISLLKNSEPTCIIIHEDFLPYLELIKEEVKTLKFFISLYKTEENLIDYEKLIENSREEEPKGPNDLNYPIWIIYTSGTTGRPKGATLTHKTQLLGCLSYLSNIYNVHPNDIALFAGPLTHGNGLYLLPYISKGATNVLLTSKSFQPKEVFETIQKRKVTVIPYIVPTQLKLLMTSEYIDNYDLSSLKTVVYGGSPIHLEDIKALLKRFGNIFVQIYGQAEMNSLISTLSKEDHVLDEKDRRYKLLKSAGKINIGVDVKIVNDKGEEVRVGEIGEIIAKNESLMLGYWSDPELTKEVVKDGWIYTGDLGYIDEEGYLYIVDRKKDVIKSGGLAIYSKEVEDVILKHPAVKEVAVIGVPDEVWGEAVKAIVVLKDNVRVSEEEIIEFCKEYLSSYKKPKSVEFVETLPKNPAGKILKRELREKYWRGMERRV